jgi:hypothetical protein
MLRGEIININIVVVIIRVPKYRDLDGQNCFQYEMQQEQQQKQQHYHERVLCDCLQITPIAE